MKVKKKGEGCYNSHYHPSVGIIWDQEEHPMILEKIEVCDGRFLKGEGFFFRFKKVESVVNVFDMM